MDQLDDRAYFSARAATCLEMARQAASPKVAEIHMELATRYQQAASVNGSTYDAEPPAALQRFG